MISYISNDLITVITESIPDDHRPPRFPRELEDMTVTRGSKVQLECEVIGFPQPSIQWSVSCTNPSSSSSFSAFIVNWAP
jgi:hypothetical protein